MSELSIPEIPKEEMSPVLDPITEAESETSTTVEVAESAVPLHTEETPSPAKQKEFQVGTNFDDPNLGTAAQTEICDDYPMASWEDKLRVPYVERFNGNICVKRGDIKAALKHYSKALFGLKMIFDGDKDRFMNNPREAAGYVRDIEIPVCLNLAHCYIKTNDFHFAIKYAGQTLEN